jgi:hypothetical protein
MRTLNRPMFRMGGPIKEGVMHGIREPRQGYAFGKEVVKQVGTKVPVVSNIYNRGIANLSKLGQKFKGLFGKTGPGTTKQQYQGYSEYGPVTYKTIKTPGTFQPNPVGKYLMGSPEAKALKYVWDGKGWVAKAAAFPFKSPLVGGALIYQGGKWLWPDGKEATDAEVESQFNFKGGTKPGEGRKEGMYYKDPDAAKKLAAKRRDERINNLLETMGYDAAKKDAVSKALIDASQIVSDRGTLDKKNITRELINPIIAATSKRLEKPEQLNEAVRLMMTKAEIEKEMNPLDDAVKRAQLAVYQKQAKGKGIQETLAEATGKGTQLQGETLASVARSLLPGDFKVMQIKVPKNTDTLEHIIDVVKESHTNPEKKPFPPGQYVLKERIVVIDEQGNVTPLDI